MPEMLLEDEDSLGQEVVAAARSVCAHLAEAWAKRRGREAFVAKLEEAEMMAVMVETWLAFAMECGCLEMEVGQGHCRCYWKIFGEIGELIEEVVAGWGGGVAA